MSYREGQFHIKQTPTPWAPTTPYTPIATHSLGPHHPLTEICVQFWSLFHEQNRLLLSNSIRYTINNSGTTGTLLIPDIRGFPRNFIGYGN